MLTLRTMTDVSNEILGARPLKLTSSNENENEIENKNDIGPLTGSVFNPIGEKTVGDMEPRAGSDGSGCECGKKRLLIVDDEVMNLKVIELGLKNFEFQLDRAFDG
jgi:hypothetical protein